MGTDDIDQLRIVGELITSTVISARSTEQQQEAVSRLRTLDELKTSFLGTASHELRTPVTAIAGFAHMLSSRWETLTEDDRRIFADRIASNARVLEALVQDLLDFARLERGEVTLMLETVDLAVVTGRVLDRLEPVWSTHAVERSITPGSLVTADAAALERIVTNLVSNAVKFSPDGSTILVTVDGTDPVRLTVDDEGPGVPDAERDRIFVRFFRGAGDAVVRTSGVGIGLSVVQDYVTKMGGRIDVRGNPAGGARFEVEFERAGDPARSQEEHSDATT
jgi:signal transduction histidine kinase